MLIIHSQIELFFFFINVLNSMINNFVSDVLCGSILGFTICWLCYHNYYPSLQDEHCHLPWVQINKKQIKELTVKDI